MPISASLEPFTSSAVALAPTAPGVYALWDQDEVIYYGRAEHSIYSRLMDHLSGRDGPCTQKASHFQTESNAQPTVRERHLLLRHRMQYGCLPRCNDVVA